MKVRMLTYSHEVEYLLFIEFAIDLVDVRKIYRKLCDLYVSEEILSVLYKNIEYC